MSVMEAKLVLTGEDRGGSATLNKVAAAMAKAEAQAKAMARATQAGVGGRMVGDLQRMGASAGQIDKVTDAWKRYATGQGVLKGQDWTKAQIDSIRQWERATVSALQRVRREETALVDAHRRAAAVAPGGKVSRDGLVSGALGLGALRAGGLALAGGLAAAEVFRRGFKEGNKIQHEHVRMAAAGISPHDLAEAQKLSGELSSHNMAFGQGEILHMMRNAQSVVGSFHEAKEIMEPMLKLRTVALGAHPDKRQELEADFDKLIKGMEIKGVTQDLPRFNKYMQGMAKAVNLFGDTLRPTDYYEMFKYGRQATQNLSDEYMFSVAPTLAQELGGSSAGKAHDAFYRAIVGGKMSNLAVNELSKIGLLDESKVTRTKTGNVKGVAPGGIKGAELAAQNPYEWVQQYLLPAFKKKGIKDDHAIQERIARMFSNTVAAQLVGLLSTQQVRIEKDGRLIHGAEGLEAAKRFQSQDPYIAAQAAQTQLDRFGASLLRHSGAIDLYTSAANASAERLAKMTDALDEAMRRVKENPEELDRQRRATLNGLLGDPSSPTHPMAWLRDQVEPGAVRAHRDKLDRDGIDAARAALENEAAPIQTQLDRYKRFDARGGTTPDREAKKAALQAQLDAIQARRKALDDSVSAHDKANLDLTEVENQRDRIDALRFRYPKIATPLKPNAGLHAFGLQGPPQVNPAFGGDQVMVAPLPPERPGEFPRDQKPFNLKEFLGDKGVPIKVDPKSVDDAHQKASALDGKLDDASKTRRLAVETGSIDAAIGKADTLIGKLTQIGTMAQGTAGAGGAGAGASSTSYADT